MPQANKRDDQQRREGVNAVPMQLRAMPVASVNEEDRSVVLCWSAGAAVRRYDWWNDEYYDELLSLDPAHVDLARLNAGAPLLNSHARYSLEDQIGVIEKAWIEKGEGLCLVRFSSRAEVEPIWQDVKAGIIRNVSVGYTVRSWLIDRTQGEIPTYTATDWEPSEVSLVPVPADIGAGVRSKEDGPPQGIPCRYIELSAAADSNQPETRKEPEMPQTQTPAADNTAAIEAARAEAQQAERQRGVDIRASVRAAGLDSAVADDLIGRGIAVADANAEILRKLAERSEQNTQRGHANVQTVRDEAETRREAISIAVQHRAGQLRSELPEHAREFRGYTLPELARYSLEKQGVNTRGMDRNEIILRSLHSTSDFSVALGNTVGRVLRQAYQIAPRSFTPWARKGTLADFRPNSRVAISGALGLEKQGEHGEIKSGYLNDAGETIQLATYSKKIGITRQVIINDDLDLFSRIPVMIAQGACATECALVYGILTGNPAMADTVALFHANHANLAGTGAVISVASLGAGRAAMRVQKEPSSKEPLNLQPKYLIVPAALETVAQQFMTSALLATKSGDINPFAGTLETIVEPRLDANSQIAWYLAADPNTVDTIEYAYLDGAEGLQVRTRDGYTTGADIDGIEILAYEDFAAKAIDYRGLYKQPGA